MRTLLLALAVVGSAATALAQEPPATAPVQLNDFRWQELPPEITAVVTGPDGRIWFQNRGGDTRPLKLEQYQTALAAQFNKPAPHIHKAQILLIEPQGRVWFYATYINMLVGYDGRTWVTRKLESNNLPTGKCPTRGELFESDANRFAGSTAWLIDRKGIHRFDGKDWSYQEIIPGPPGVAGQPLLAVHHEGKIAAAYHKRSRDLWLYRDNAWKRIENFVPDDIQVLSQFAFEAPDSLLCLGFKKMGQPGKRNQLLRYRLKEDGSLEPDQPDSLRGSIRLASIGQVHTDAEGTIYVKADIIDDPADGSAKGGGVAVQTIQGKTRVVRHPQIATFWNGIGSVAGIHTISREQIWLSTQVGSARLFDWKKAAFVEELSLAEMRNVHAIDNQGRLYVTKQPTYESPRPNIMVYTPEGRARPTLQVTTKEIKYGDAAVSEDGTIWTIDVMGHLVCWEGGEWKQLLDESVKNEGIMIPGQGEMLLYYTDKQAMLCERAKIIARGDLLEIIENHREHFVRGFGPRQPPLVRHGGNSFPRMQIVADSDGRIWLNRGGSVLVFEKDRWLLGADALTEAGFRTNDTVLAPFVPGDRVYFSGRGNTHSYFGQIRDGKLQFTAAPPTLFTQAKILALPGPTNSVWLTSMEGTQDRYSKYLALRFNEQGLADTLRNEGVPTLIDHTGNLWLAPIWSLAPDKADVLKVWRDGKVRQQIKIPKYANGLILSDAPGSVYAITDAGFQHLKTKDKNHFEYQLGELFLLDDVKDDRFRYAKESSSAYSSQGYVVVTRSRRGVNEGHYLQTIQLPKP